VSFYLVDDAILIRSLLSEETSPPELSDSLFLYYALLMRAKGSAVTPSDVHDAWTAWIYLTKGRHQALVPYGDLDSDTRDKDLPYMKAIHRAAEIRAAS
jgi:hypothetical protein